MSNGILGASFEIEASSSGGVKTSGFTSTPTKQTQTSTPLYVNGVKQTSPTTIMPVFYGLTPTQPKPTTSRLVLSPTAPVFSTQPTPTALARLGGNRALWWMAGAAVLVGGVVIWRMRKKG